MLFSIDSMKEAFTLQASSKPSPENPPFSVSTNLKLISWFLPSPKKTQPWKTHLKPNLRSYMYVFHLSPTPLGLRSVLFHKWTWLCLISRLFSWRQQCSWSSASAYWSFLSSKLSRLLGSYTLMDSAYLEGISFSRPLHGHLCTDDCEIMPSARFVSTFS